MTTKQAFEKLLQNIVLDNDEQLSKRYCEITKKLNKTFRDTESETANSLRVGSYGRYTGIKGISDLDMLYIMPDSKWHEYKNAPDKLLRDTRNSLQERWPNTDITYDTLVVVINFTNFKFEIQPVFIDWEDGDDLPFYWFPSTKEGVYKKTKPKHEQAEMTNFRNQNGDTHRYLCKIMRAWKNKSGLAMSGLLLDTLTYNFLNDNPDYKSAALSSFDVLVRDFFAYLKDQPQQDYYLALGSRQYVYVKHPFKTKSRKAYSKAVKAIAETDETARHNYWREVFGNAFPKADNTVVENRVFSADSSNVVDREQFIENFYPMNVSEELKIDCRIIAEGFRPILLSALLGNFKKISTSRKLEFFIVSTTVEKPYEVKWKVRNVGDEAVRRHCLRGEILPSNKGEDQRKESSDFRGPHYVECYIIKKNMVVALDHIDVPIL